MTMKTLGRLTKTTGRKLLAALSLVCAMGMHAATAGEPVIINEKSAFPEGPMMLGDKLLYVEYGANDIMVWDGKTNTPMWKKDGCGPSAIVSLGDNFAVTCFDSNEMAIVSADGRTVATYAKDDDGGPLPNPNDATPDGKGGIFFTTTGNPDPSWVAGGVFHMTSDGKIKKVAGALQQANGITLSPDRKLLYVAESHLGRIDTFKVGEDMTLSDQRMFVDMALLPGEPADSNPDGLKFGPDGNIYVGGGTYNRILVLGTDGRLIRKISLAAVLVPNFTWSADGKTMYVMTVDDGSNAPYPGRVMAIAD